MKKLYFLVILCFVLSSSTFAQPSIHFGIGGKYWLANWDLDMEGFTSASDMKNWLNSDDSDMPMIDSESGNLIGPSLSVNFGKVSVTGSYLMGSWEWPGINWISEDVPWYGIDLYEENGNLYYNAYPIGPGDPVTYNGVMYDDYFIPFAAVKPDRKDIILTVAYQIIPKPNVSVFAGMKSVSYEYELSYNYQALFADDLGINYIDISNYNPTETDKIEVSGTGFGGGLSTSIPVGASGAFVYGSAAYIKLGGDFESSNISAEGGVGFKPIGVPIVGTLGYRFEDYENDEKIDGVTVGLSYFK